MSDRNQHQPSLKLTQTKVADEELTNEFWINGAKKILDEQLKKEPNMKQAKNIIFFLGDGMSYASVGKFRINFSHNFFHSS